MSIIYLDHNRTTPLAPSVLEAMQPYWSDHFLLPEQEHPRAQAVAEALEHARENVAALVGCEPFEIVFTSGGTEANNLAVLGVTLGHSPGHLILSPLEHDSVLGAANSLTAQGLEVETLPCDKDGVVAPDFVASRLRQETRLVCVQLANPVLGTIQPIRQIADVCSLRGVSLHCDATQAFGKIKVDVTQIGADTVSVSSHKFYGPKGSGALYVRRGLKLSPISFGESREMGLRPGTENTPACIGLGVAANLAAKCVGDAESSLLQLRSRFVKGVIDTIDASPILLGGEQGGLPNTACVELPVRASHVQRVARDLVISTARSTDPPDEMTRVLRAVGRSNSEISRTIRISAGWTTSRDQIDRATRLLAEACDSARI